VLSCRPFYLATGLAKGLPESPSMIHIPFSRHRLDNGLEVVLSRDPEVPVVAVNLWYRVGSRDERPGRTGFAHLFEHMMFQGSENVPETAHFAHIEKAGGSLNGSTWLDRTNYFETLPGQLPGAGAVAGVGPPGLAGGGHDAGEAGQPAGRGEERAALARGQPAVR
jgi:hypothetical protein